MGPLVSWSFPNQLSVESKIRAASSNADLAYSEYKKVILNALKETEIALNNYQETMKELEVQKLLQEKKHIRYEQYKQFYQGGLISLTELLQIEKELLVGELQKKDVYGQLAARQIQIFLALGGGWSNSAQIAADLVQQSILQRSKYQKK